MSETKQELPINRSRVIIEQAKGTIKSIIDAVVELVTNSDDSFKNLEQAGVNVKNPTIQIFVRRKKSGICEELAIVDNASGMTGKELIEAIKFGAETSGFKEGKRVRGFFGRGLKESIIALGRGVIISKKFNDISGVRIWIEKEESDLKVFYSKIEDERYLEDQVKKYISTEDNGTIISITSIYEEFKIPTDNTLFRQISKHYQLRDINSSPDRNVVLTYYEPEKKNLEVKMPIKYVYPTGTKLPEKEIVIDNGVSYLKIFEAEEQLDSPLHDILGEAGILIKTEGSILENTLFKYAGEEAGLYFFGSLDDPEIAHKLREHEMLISANRTGLDWRHPYLKKVKEAIEEELKNIILAKKIELNSNQPQDLTEKNKALVDKLKNLLNAWAKAEDMSWESPIDPTTLDTMMLKPEYLEVEKDTPRDISIYLPKEILDIYGADKIKIVSDNPLIQISEDKLSFRSHKNYPEISVGKFPVTGEKINEEGIVSCTLGDYSALSIVSVVEKIESKTGRGKKKLNPKSGGFLRDIRADARDNPTQRVSYDSDLGEIRIYVNFPGIKDYLKAGLVGSESPEGSIIIAELVIEVFCRTLAIKGLNTGKYLILGTDKDSIISAYNKAYYDLMKEYSEKTQRAIMSHFKN